MSYDGTSIYSTPRKMRALFAASPTMRELLQVADESSALARIHTYDDESLKLPYPRVIAFDEPVTVRTSSEGTVLGVTQRQIETWFWIYIPDDVEGIEDAGDEHAYMLHKIGDVVTECLALGGTGEPIPGQTHVDVMNPTFEGVQRVLPSDRTDVGYDDEDDGVDVQPELSLWQALVMFEVH